LQTGRVSLQTRPVSWQDAVCLHGPGCNEFAKVRAWLESAGISQHELGTQMGYSEDVARKAVWQFLRSKDPRIGMLRRFATAAGIPIEELVTGAKATAKRKK
jgi:transcriptional regulator with XRE-family HTH domain